MNHRKKCRIGGGRPGPRIRPPGKEAGITAKRIYELLGERNASMGKLARACRVKLSTVGWWLRGPRSSRPPTGENILEIAKWGEVTASWLLGEEGAPKYPRQWRTNAKLADDLAEFATREAMINIDIPEPWIREMLSGLISGPTLLGLVVEIVETELRANAEHFRKKAAAAKGISQIEAAAAKETDEALAQLARLFATPPPAGRAIPWQPMTFTRPGRTPITMEGVVGRTRS